MPGTTQNRGRIFDAECELKDAGLVAASAAGTVDSAAAVYDTGGGFTPMSAVFDISACEIASSDELYKLSIQGSSSPTFASDITDLAVLEVGDVTQYPGDVENTTGRFILQLTNMKGNTTYRYIREYSTISGAIATGINFTCFLSNMQS